jgi:acyl-CoA synthetase (AMP-forming)/AMP-acid ligase II
MAVTTLVDLVEERVADAPDATAYIFLEDGERDARSLTRGALATRARAIAARLLDSAQPGDRVLLVLPPGLDYIAAFFGCLFAGVIAVPAYPPDPGRLARTLPRLVAIARAADARILVTTKAAAALAAVPELAGVQCIAADEPYDLPYARPPITADTVAMLQFTSGSTSSPRGVVLAHANLLANLAAISAAFGLADHPPRIASWLPPYHDMGLIGAILSSLYAGGTTIAMSPLHFLQRPARWLRMIHRYRADVSGGPNFAFDLCARKVDLAAEPEPLDLSCWSVAFNGAEVVRAATLERFAAKLAPAGFRRTALFPCYGLAESSLLVSGASRGQGATVLAVDAGERVSSGRPAPGIEVVIVDPASREPIADGRVGEIWVRGDSVGRGYWGRDDDSGRTFRATTADGRGPYLRTGDLGFVVDGELYVSGRIKDVIVVHGRKLFPDDIERVVAGAHVCVRPGGIAAIAIDMHDREQLAIVVEVTGGDAAELRTAITRAVVERFDVAPASVTLVAPGELPKTSSGKIQRHACRALLGEVRGE